jgi:hypothetical protein
MMDLGRLETLLYRCRMSLYWWEEDEMQDWRDAKLVSIKDDEITLYREDTKEYWSWDIDTLEAKIEYLQDEQVKILMSL